MKVKKRNILMKLRCSKNPHITEDVDQAITALENLENRERAEHNPFKDDGEYQEMEQPKFSHHLKSLLQRIEYLEEKKEKEGEMTLNDILDYFYEVACAIEDKQEEYITEKELKDRTKKAIQELILGEAKQRNTELRKEVEERRYADAELGGENTSGDIESIIRRLKYHRDIARSLQRKYITKREEK